MTRQGHQGRLAGRRALITGASSGLGAAIAEPFSAEGGEVALVSRDPASPSETARRLQGTAHVIPADVSDPTPFAARYGRRP